MPEGWLRSRLGEVTEQVSRPVLLSGSETYRTLGVRAKGQGVFEREPQSGSDIKAKRLFVAAEGDFIYNRLFAGTGSFGIVRDQHAGALVSNEFPLFRCDPERLNVEYLYLVFQLPRTWQAVETACTGTTQSRSRWKEEHFRAFDVCLPPVSTQYRVLDLAGAVDLARTRALALVDHLRGALDALEQDAASRFASLPMRPLGEIADVVGGATKDSKKEDSPDLVDVPYLRVANVQRGRLSLEEIKTIRLPKKKAGALALVDGDVLLNEGGDRDKLGRGWVWEDQIPGCVHQNHVFRARMHNTSQFDPKFISLWANTFGQRWFYENGSQTTGIASISLSTLRRFPVPTVGIDEQRQLAHVGDGFRSQLVAAERNSAALADLRSGLLVQLLSGDHLIPETYDLFLEAV